MHTDRLSDWIHQCLLAVIELLQEYIQRGGQIPVYFRPKPGISLLGETLVTPNAPISSVFCLIDWFHLLGVTDSAPKVKKGK